MNTWPLAPYVFATGVLLAGLLQVASAAPAGGAPVAGKPKFAPRAIPGVGGHAHAAESAPAPAATAKPRAAKPAGVTASSAAPADQARILYIFRRGTVVLPPTPVNTSAPAPEPTPSADIRITPSIVPRPGQVRIISKAEAEALLAQPELQK